MFLTALLRTCTSWIANRDGGFSLEHRRLILIIVRVVLVPFFLTRLLNVGGGDRPEREGGIRTGGLELSQGWDKCETVGSLCGQGGFGGRAGERSSGRCWGEWAGTENWRLDVRNCCLIFLFLDDLWKFFRSQGLLRIGRNCPSIQFGEVKGVWVTANAARTGRMAWEISTCNCNEERKGYVKLNKKQIVNNIAFTKDKP